jgi:hypothetical protein
MTIQKNVFVMVICLLFGVLIGFSIDNIVLINENTSEVYEKLPRKSFVVILEKNTKEKFFTQLQQFSTEEGFAIRISPTTPNEDSFIIEMWREDIKIIALNSFEAERFNIAFFDTDGLYPYPLPNWALDTLVNSFKVSINKIQGIQIID